MALPSTDKSVCALLEAQFAGAARSEAEGLLIRFVDDAFAYATETLGIADLRAAWDEFRVWLGRGIDPRSADWRLFLAWYVFHWHSCAVKAGQRPELPSIGERCLKERPDRHAPAVHLLVRSAVGTPMDFYEVLYLPDFERYYLKSLFLGYQQSFGFETLPDGLEVGQVYLAKIVHLFDDQGVVAGASPPLGTRAKVEVGYLRRNLIRSRATDFTRDFWLFDADVFNLYHDLQAPPPA